jgi:glutathione synthase/RimK-type ligase-like ATP-grasp enzyme
MWAFFLLDPPLLDKMNILVATIYGDLHAVAVDIALSKQGHSITRWFPALLPTSGSISFSIKMGCMKTRLGLLPDLESSRSFDHYDVLWNRRVGIPITKHLPLSEADKEPAKSDLYRTVSSYLRHISQTTVAINCFDAARIAEDKIHQLSIACKAGLRTPETLLSNNPEDIHRFLLQTDSTYICKPLFPIVWQQAGGQVAMAMTSRLQTDDLPADEILQAGPMILQKEVKKAHEIRVTCMGGFLHAVRLNSQINQSSSLDWRAVNPSLLKMEETILPTKLADQCLEILAGLNLHFGCIDLIVDPSGEYIFLEVNQMGEFLWIEKFSRNIPMLDHFCSFLLSRDGNYNGIPTVETGGYLSLTSEIEAILEKDLALHQQKIVGFADLAELTPNIIIEASKW